MVNSIFRIQLFSVRQTKYMRIIYELILFMGGYVLIDTLSNKFYFSLSRVKHQNFKSLFSFNETCFRLSKINLIPIMLEISSKVNDNDTSHSDDVFYSIHLGILAGLTTLLIALPLTANKPLMRFNVIVNNCYCIFHMIVVPVFTNLRDRFSHYSIRGPVFDYVTDLLARFILCILVTLHYNLFLKQKIRQENDYVSNKNNSNKSRIEIKPTEVNQIHGNQTYYAYNPVIKSSKSNHEESTDKSRLNTQNFSVKQPNSGFYENNFSKPTARSNSLYPCIDLLPKPTMPETQENLIKNLGFDSDENGKFNTNEISTIKMTSSKTFYNIQDINHELTRKTSF